MKFVELFRKMVDTGSVDVLVGFILRTRTQSTYSYRSSRVSKALAGFEGPRAHKCHVSP